MGLKRTLRKIKTDIQSKKIVSEVLPMLSEKMPLEVSRRSGFFVFHNKGNSLISRGEVYEPEVQQGLKVLVGLDRMRNDITVVADIGANIGLHSFYLKSLYPNMQIVAFDPSPSSWKYMELSIKYNKINDINLLKIALSDKNGTIDLFSWGEESSADALVNTGRVYNIKPKLINVPVARIDDLKELPRITVIKMDCEGSELSILKGGKKLLLENKPLILLEFNKNNMQAFNVDADQVLAFMAEINYSIYSLDFIKLDRGEFEVLLNGNVENYIILPNGLVK